MTGCATSIGDWLGQIRSCLACGKENTLALAKLLCSAKRQLQYGEWSQLWKAGQIPFSKRKGDMLATVGERLGDLDEQTFAQLPSGWSILYQLSQLSSRMLREQILAGTVHPGLTLQEARDLVRRLRGPRSPAATARRLRVLRRVRSFCQFVQDSLSQWSRADRDQAGCQLGRLAVEISAGTATVHALPRQCSWPELKGPLLVHSQRPSP